MAQALARLLSCLLAAALLAGCSGQALVNALTPDTGYRVERDLAYGVGPRHRLDLYLPDGAPTDAALVVFFYGGNWQTGTKELYRFVGQALASRGYVTAIPDYRLHPEVRWEGFLADAADAVRWLAARPAVPEATAAPSGTKRPVFLVGHSAGAYIAAMLALDGRWLGEPGLGRHPPIDAAVGLAGPYDFLPLEDPNLMEIFGPGPASPVTQPITHADGADPPMLLITGTADETVRPGNTRRLTARLREAGGRAEERLYAGQGHIRLVAALAAPLRFLAPTLDDVDAFLRQVRAPSHRRRADRG